MKTRVNKAKGTISISLTAEELETLKMACCRAWLYVSNKLEHETREGFDKVHINNMDKYLKFQSDFIRIQNKLEK